MTEEPESYAARSWVLVYRAPSGPDRDQTVVQQTTESDDVAGQLRRVEGALRRQQICLE